MRDRELPFASAIRGVDLNQTMNSSAATHSPDIHSSSQRSYVSSKERLHGKRVAMLLYSHYPEDPRPRRAVSALISEGMQVDLVCLGSGSAPRHEILDGIDVLRIPLKHRRGGKLAYAYQYGVFILISSVIFALRSLTRSYDLVYVHNMPDILILSALIPKLLGAKVILDLHDPMPELMMTIFRVPPDSRGVRLLKRVEKWSIARADLVITTNIAFKKVFAARSCPPEKIEVVMNSPDGKIFPFRPVGSEVSAGTSGNKPLVIMYHGSLLERNGLDVAIDAFARLRESIPAAELRIFGASTPFLERMMEVVRNNNLQESVHYLGSKLLEDLVPEIERCDLGVIPNPRNAFTEINMPTRIFEYLALGKPVIAPYTPGILDYFNKESLLFFESGNSDDLAGQIEYAFSHPFEVHEIVRRGQQVLLEHTWDRERETLVGSVSGILPR